jgi:hypothetical protein
MIHLEQEHLSVCRYAEYSSHYKHFTTVIMTAVVVIIVAFCHLHPSPIFVGKAWSSPLPIRGSLWVVSYRWH